MIEMTISTIPSQKSTEEDLGFFSSAKDEDDDRVSIKKEIVLEATSKRQTTSTLSKQSNVKRLKSSLTTRNADEILNSGLNSDSTKPTFIPGNLDALEVLSLSWSTNKKASADSLKGQEEIILRVYNHYLKDISLESAILASLSILCNSHYLDNLLWPTLDSESPLEHYLSVSLLIYYHLRTKKTNELFFLLVKNDEKFNSFILGLKSILLDDTVDLKSKNCALLTIQSVYESMDIPEIRSLVLPFLQIQILQNTLPFTLASVRNQHEQIEKSWKSSEKRMKKVENNKEDKKKQEFINSFFSRFILMICEEMCDEGEMAMDEYHIMLIERSVQFLTGLLTQLPTRRYLNTLLIDHGIISYLHNSKAFITGKENYAKMRLNPDSTILGGIQVYKFGLVLKETVFFPIHDFTGKPLSPSEVEHVHYEQLLNLQKTLFGKHRQEFEGYCLMTCGNLGKHETLKTCFTQASFDVLLKLAESVGIRTHGLDNKSLIKNSILIDLFINKYGRKGHSLESIEHMPVYPTDLTMFDEITLPKVTRFFHPLPLPRINLQFLSIQEYVSRLFQVYMIDASVDMRMHIESVLKKSSPKYGVPIERCKIIEIGKNLIGSTKPSKVIIEITYDLNKFLDAGLRDEWDSFRMDDIVSLQSIKSKPQIYTTESELKVDHLTGRELAQVLGLESVRGGQIVGLVGDDGKLMNHFDLNIIQSIIEAVKKLPPDQLNKYKKEAMLKIISDSGFSKGIFGSKRSLRISMDVNTYAGDTLDYTMFNYLIRKEPKLNGCKNVSEGMKEMLLKSSGVNSGTFLPDFVRDQWLGTGKMGEADYLNSKHVNRQFIMHNVFQNDAHLTECFDCNIEFRGVREFTGSYIISFPRSMFLNLETEEMSSELQEVCISNKLDLKNDDKEGCIIVRDCPFVYNGPFVDAPVKMIQTNKLNKQQVNAIHAGLSHGLTVINGAFGTGKTEVASTIIQNLLSNFSEQRILLVSAHQKSVDTIFDKVIQQSSIDARYLVRVGFDGGDSYFSTEELLETDRYGRLQLFTSKRADLLDKVDKLAASLDCLGAYGNSCETATYFNETHVVTKWHTFHFRVINEFEKTSQVIREHFPFSRYFDTTNSNQLFPKDSSYETSLTIAEGCFRYLKTLFKQLEDMRAFEILRTDVDRANYLVVKEAKLIAMTCSFASLKRNQLSQLGFTFDTIIYEDANLSNEIESLMSIQLQTTNSGQSRLKRIILLGNDQGLLFSSKHAALDTTNLEQSLFKRFIRLGVPGIVLDGPLRFQRDFMVQLLSNKSNQIPNPKTLANPGFCFDSQFINVPTFMKMNEHTPQVGHYQNIGEAEYSVATFMYMRLMGYQSNDISILTTYKGQRDLIIDVLNRRCSSNPIFGKPRDVSHVDSYVGLENKYVIVSLVRTTNDINPLNERNVKFILSRASIGLYVFGRIKCLEKVDGCEDMCRVFKTRPTDLCILLKESFDTCSRRYDQTGLKIRADGSSQANATQTRIVKGVEEFGKIVYNLTEEHLKNMRK